MKFNDHKRHRNSWDQESHDYNRIVGEKGHYYHQKVVIPKSLGLLKMTPESQLLDVGCGQGVLGRTIHRDIAYVGIDASRDLVNLAKRMDQNLKHKYIHANASRPLPLEKESFTHAACLLALQNMEEPKKAIFEISKLLKKGGVFVIVLNHPAFRIPRQTGWGVHSNQVQYRWVNGYMGMQKIPIVMHPGKHNSPVTYSYHYPISDYVSMLTGAGFVITGIDEWTSDKKSAGPTAKAENKARAEIPLFMAIRAEKR